MTAVRNWIPVGLCRLAVHLAMASVLAVTSIACGSAVYIKRSTIDASSSVAAARAVDAETWAPYEYTRAVEYLHKSREEASYADFQSANRFARLSHDAAVEAKKLAVERSANPAKDDWRPPKKLREGAGGSGESAPAGSGDDDGEASDADADAPDADADADTDTDTDDKAGTKGGPAPADADDAQPDGEI